MMTETSSQIRQLGAADFEEAIEVMNHAFFAGTSKDFRHLLPKLYRATDELMSCHYAAVCDGGIKAIVGLYPADLSIDGVPLRVAGIGAVCTHPQYRGRGLMQKLMQRCVEEARTQGYHLSWLGGQRQRYAYFGYERCGTAIQFNLNRSNIAHTRGIPADIHFEVMEQHQRDRLQRALALHAAQAIHTMRPEAELYAHLTCWNSQPHAALVDNEMVGYLIARPGGAIGELVADNEDTALQIARTWLEQSGTGETSLVVGPLEARRLSLFGTISESATVAESGNWQVFDWVSVVETLLKARLSRSSLMDGMVRMSIEDYGVLEIEVSHGQGSCRLVNGPATIESDALLAHRLLFGPLRPSQIIELPAAAAALDAWCPLPLYWAPQDNV